MKRELIAKLHGDFEHLVQHEQDSGVEFWLARHLQKLLGYTRWENFAKVIEKARSACTNAGYSAADHFLDVTKMAGIGSGAQRTARPCR